MRSIRSFSIDPRFAVAGTLALIGVIVALDLWLVDQTAKQSVVGILMGTELVAFATLSYIYYKPRFSEASTLWLLVGYATIAIFLILALFVGTS